jgi:hypothetical protein
MGNRVSRQRGPVRFVERATIGATYGCPRRGHNDGFTHLSLPEKDRKKGKSSLFEKKQQKTFAPAHLDRCASLVPPAPLK